MISVHNLNGENLTLSSVVFKTYAESKLTPTLLVRGWIIADQPVNRVGTYCAPKSVQISFVASFAQDWLCLAAQSGFLSHCCLIIGSKSTHTSSRGPSEVPILHPCSAAHACGCKSSGLSSTDLLSAWTTLEASHFWYPLSHLPTSAPIAWETDSS